ncbi:MAG: sodium/substrate symporter small subunit [Hyphomicrobium sp.]
MIERDVQGASRPTRKLIVVSVVLWAVLTFALPLAALTLNAVKFAGFPLGFWITAVFVLIALAALAMVFATRAGGDSRGEGVSPSLRLAGEAIGSAGVIGSVGAIAALGYDGLAFPLGLAAGLALLTIIVAPRFALYPVRTIAGFFTARYGGVWPRRLALAITGIGSISLLAADLRGGALAVQGAFATDYATGVAITTVALAIVWVLRSLLPVPSGRGAVFAALLVMVFIPVFALPIYQGRLPLPLFVYGYGLEDLAALEQKLIVNKLADVRSLKPMTAPFLQLSMTNFAGFVLALALGLAALPYLLGRHLSQVAVAPGAAPRRAALGSVWVVWFLLALAAFAVFERIGVADMLAKGIETAALPPALVDAAGRGWVSICGVSSYASSEITAACAKASGHRGFLRLQDVAFSSDGFAVAAPWISGLPPAAFMPLWFAAALAALVTGHALIAGFLAADAEGRHSGTVDATGLDFRSVVLGVVMLLMALVIAMIGGLEIPALFSEGLAVIAAGLFPALILGLFWRRMTAAGAVAAMLAGFAVTAAYIAGVRHFPILMFAWTGGFSDAAPGAVRKFSDLSAAFSAATSDDARVMTYAALWRHAGGIANWWGLKPVAAVLFGVPVGFLAGLSVSVLWPKRTEDGPARD